MNPLCPEEEYNNNPNLRREDTKYLKEWLSKQPHLPAVTEYMLMMFLHACEYRLEATKHTIECHYTLKTDAPEVWSGRDPLLPAVQRVLQYVQFAALPEKDPAGNLVLMCRMSDPDLSHFVYADSSKAYAMFHDMAVQRAGLVRGVVMVVDQNNFALGLVTRINISLLRNLVAYLQDGFLGKVVKIHVINCVPVTEKLLAITKPFLKSQLIDKLIIHANGLTSFYEYVPKEILPQEYGGNAGSFDDLHKKSIEELKQHRDWFLEEEKLRVDESKRLGPDKYSRNEFGISGSFRKLELD